MSQIVVNIPLTKYLKLQNEYLGGEAVLSKVYKGKVYMSESAPWIDPEDSSNYDFDDLPIPIQKSFSHHIDLKVGETKTVKQVIKEIKEKEKANKI